MKELIARKINVNDVNEIGSTALLCACEKGHIEIIELLVGYGADLTVYYILYIIYIINILYICII